MADDHKKTVQYTVHQESVAHETVTTDEYDQYSRRRFIQRGALAVAGTFGVLPLMQMAKIDVAMGAQDLPGSEEEYRRRLEAELGDRAEAEDLLGELKLRRDHATAAEGGRHTCTCGCNCNNMCNCLCSCSCGCSNPGGCDCICTCGCSCNCGCNCACDCTGQCNCVCDTNPSATVFNAESDARFTGTATSAARETATPTSTTEIATAVENTGGQTTTGGRNNNAVDRGSAEVENTSLSNIDRSGETQVADQYVETADNELADDAQTRLATAIPTVGPFGMFALAIGLAGAGWRVLRKRVQDGAEPEPPEAT